MKMFSVDGVCYCNLKFVFGGCRNKIQHTGAQHILSHIDIQKGLHSEMSQSIQSQRYDILSQVGSAERNYLIVVNTSQHGLKSYYNLAITSYEQFCRL